MWAANGTIQTSDLRFKNVVERGSEGDFTLGLSFIRKLDPIAYTKTEGNDGEVLHYGLGAQDVEKVLGDHRFAGLIKPKNDKEKYGLVYAEFTASIIAAIQTLANDNDKIVERLRALETRGN